MRVGGGLPSAPSDTSPCGHGLECAHGLLGDVGLKVAAPRPGSCFRPGSLEGQVELPGGPSVLSPEGDGSQPGRPCRWAPSLRKKKG